MPTEPQKVPPSVIVKLQFQGCDLFVLFFVQNQHFHIGMSRPKIDNNDVE